MPDRVEDDDVLNEAVQEQIAKYKALMDERAREVVPPPTRWQRFLAWIGDW